jgi:DNA-binding NtrC family response regulator
MSARYNGGSSRGCKITVCLSNYTDSAQNIRWYNCIDAENDARGRCQIMMVIEHEATLADAVRRHIILALAACGGNRTHAARTLNISIRCLRDKLREYANAGIQVTPAQRSSAETRPGGTMAS